MEEGRRRNDAGRGEVEVEVEVEEEVVVVEGAREKERAVRRGGRLGRKEKMATPHPIDKTRGAVPQRNSPSSNNMQSYYSVISFTVRSPIKIPVLK